MQERGSERFPASMRLKGATSFRRVFQRGRIHRSEEFALHLLDQPGVTRVGIVLSRRWGTAVERNRMRRRIREIVRRHRETFADAEIIVRPSDGSKGCSYQSLERALLRDVRQVHDRR
jgi:ribonuclease P protein component